MALVLTLHSHWATSLQDACRSFIFREQLADPDLGARNQICVSDQFPVFGEPGIKLHRRKRRSRRSSSQPKSPFSRKGGRSRRALGYPAKSNYSEYQNAALI
jgi:hypothetical protein